MDYEYVGTSDPMVRDLDKSYASRRRSGGWLNPNHSAGVLDNHPYVWQEDASCRDALPDMFDLATKETPGYEDSTFDELKEENLARWEYASAFCGTCPVKATCLKNADPSDLYWSIRGGEQPTRLVEMLAPGKTPRQYGPAFQYNDYKLWACKKHARDNVGKIKRKDKDGNYYFAPFCITCGNENKNPDRPR